jgi:16S rRNA A1518/A1519 N6-dimethyltransferase RsmA/KsgA/DIM1 with predicted DNA glycosylase/AP lyase activity
VLISAFKNQLDKPQIDEALAEQQLDESLRAEQLSVEQLLALSEALRQKLPATAE